MPGIAEARSQGQPEEDRERYSRPHAGGRRRAARGNRRAELAFCARVRSREVHVCIKPFSLDARKAWLHDLA